MNQTSINMENVTDFDISPIEGITYKITLKLNSGLKIVLLLKNGISRVMYAKGLLTIRDDFGKNYELSKLPQTKQPT